MFSPEVGTGLGTCHHTPSAVVPTINTVHAHCITSQTPNRPTPMLTKSTVSGIDALLLLISTWKCIGKQATSSISRGTKAFDKFPADQSSHQDQGPAPGCVQIHYEVILISPAGHCRHSRYGGWWKNTFLEAHLIGLYAVWYVVQWCRRWYRHDGQGTESEHSVPPLNADHNTTHWHSGGGKQ